MAPSEDNFTHSEHYDAVLAVLGFILLHNSDLPQACDLKLLRLIMKVLDLIILFLHTSVKKQFNKLSSIKRYSDRYPLSAHGASSVASSPSL